MRSVLGAVSSSNTDIVTDNLVLYYEGSNPYSISSGSSAVNDITSNNFNATMFGNAVYSSLAYGSIAFDGNSDYVSTSSSLNLQRDFSIEMWYRTNSDSAAIAGEGAPANNSGLHLNQYNHHSIRFGMYSNDRDFVGSPINTGEWYHVVFTYRHSSPWTKQIFKNGIKLNTFIVGSEQAWTGNAQFHLGTLYNVGYAWLNGNIGRVRVYSKILSDAEVLRNFNSEKHLYSATLGTINTASALGLRGARYNGYFNDNVNWFNSAAVTSGPSLYTSITGGHGGGDFFSLQWTGYFIPNATGTWTFYTSSDDASYLWIGSVAQSGWSTGNATVNNGGLHGTQERSGSVTLNRNQIYPIRIQFGENGGGEVMDVNIAGPSLSKTTNLTNFVVSNPSGSAPNYGF